MMSVTVPLKTMSVEEKVCMMEMLWDDLCQQPEGVQSPDWHEPVLSERAQSLSANKEEVIDWHQVKENIKKKLNED